MMMLLCVWWWLWVHLTGRELQLEHQFQGFIANIMLLVGCTNRHFFPAIFSAWSTVTCELATRVPAVTVIWCCCCHIYCPPSSVMRWRSAGWRMAISSWTIGRTLTATQSPRLVKLQGSNFCSSWQSRAVHGDQAQHLGAGQVCHY